MPDHKRLLLRIEEVAEMLESPKTTLYSWLATGKGPRSVLLPNRRVKYRVKELEVWLASLPTNVDELPDWYTERQL
jgi:predicted DNA-binding transcriptional regulator AlpA